MSVLAAVCTKMPEAKLAIALIPMFSLTAGSVSLTSLRERRRERTTPCLTFTGLVVSWGTVLPRSAFRTIKLKVDPAPRFDLLVAFLQFSSFLGPQASGCHGHSRAGFALKDV